MRQHTHASVGETSANPVRGTLRHTNETFRMFDPRRRGVRAGQREPAARDTDVSVSHLCSGMGC